MKKHLATTLILIILFVSSLFGRETWNFNRDWCLSIGDEPAASSATFDDSGWKRVTLPHAWNEDEAFRVLIDDLTDTIVWYRKHFALSGVEGNNYFLEVEGVRQAGVFYVNGKLVGMHENGITAFGLNITDFVREGENVIAVRTDNAWDYREKESSGKFQWNDHNFNANYGGMPKNVWLHRTGKIYQTLPLYRNLGTIGTYIYARDYDVSARKATIHAESEVMNETGQDIQATYRVTLIDRDGKEKQIWQSQPEAIQAGKTALLAAEESCADLHFWSWGYGYLYDVRTEVLVGDQVVDAVVTRTGFRKTAFGEGKIWLNDRVIMMHGYAQRTSNEWPAVGMSVPAWLSDYSNGLLVESGGNLVRWMHTCPWKQDVESCDRVGLIQAMPAGDAEKDREGKQWRQRVAAMRDAIIYNRNNPSILFYESGNAGISEVHMAEMKALRDQYDPYGGRAIGCREMLAIDIAEYGGEMLYINKSHKHPMWQMEYCRDEALRLYWDEQSYPYHQDGDGPLYRGKPAKEYNRNQNSFAVELIRRWYDYWLERPGRGKRVNGGGAKIVFSDTNTHCRGAENYRRSGVTDAMRIPKDGFFAHQVMWDGWVTPERDHTYIIGHWNYADTVKKDVQVVSSGDKVELLLNAKKIAVEPIREYDFLFTFPNIAFVPGKLEAISYRSGKEISRYAIETAGEPAALRLTPITNPLGWHADGADMALIEVEVVDKQGRRCPLDNRLIHWTVSGPAEYRGGIAKGDNNFILSEDLPVECGVNRIIVRSTTEAGKVTVTASADGLKKQSLSLTTVATANENGLSTYIPSRELQGSLVRGETPATPSYTDELIGIDIREAHSPANDSLTIATYDDNEYSYWENDGQLSTAEITYSLARPAAICDIALKLGDWKSRQYPLQVLAGDKLVWEGWTDGSLGYVHLVIDQPEKADTYTIRMVGQTRKIDLSNQVGELAGGKTNQLEGGKTGKGTLKIIEIDLLERATKSSPSTYVLPPEREIITVPYEAPKPPKKPSIAEGVEWPNGAKLAVSITFDDGLLEHYTVAYPLLKELGLRGTFWIIGRDIDKQRERKEASPMTWKQIKEMSQNGQEIANHTYTHKDLDKLSLQDAKKEIEMGAAAIFAQTLKQPTALAFPSNHKHDSLVMMVEQMGLYPRIEQQSFGGKKMATDEAFDKWIKSQLKRGGWAVTMTHGISVGYDAFPEPEVFENHLRKLAELQAEGKIWIAPFSEVMDYIKKQ